LAIQTEQEETGIDTRHWLGHFTSKALAPPAKSLKLAKQKQTGKAEPTP